MKNDLDTPIPYVLSPSERAWIRFGTVPNGPVEPDEFDELGDVSDGPVDYWYGKQ